MSDMRVSAKLHHAEAVTLCHALVSEIASSASCRVLIIKGQSSVWHSLRPPRVPADVDVLLAPADVDRFLDAMTGIGWYERLADSPVTLPVSRHSVTLIHDSWPCDVDVHYRYPGLLAEPSRAFDVLWSRRVKMPIAGICVNIPDKVSSIIVTALHSFRGNPTQVRHAYELQELLALGPALAESERAGLREVARLTKADIALDGLLKDLGIAVPEGKKSDDAAADSLWHEDSEITHSRPRLWMRYIRQAPLRRWPSRIKTALWPSDALFLKMHPEYSDGRSLTLARLGRVRKGVILFLHAIASFVWPKRSGHKARFRQTARVSSRIDPK